MCVTENRAAFIPWLVWNFEKQSWHNKELIIVDSSASPDELSSITSDMLGPNICVVPVRPGLNIPAKRNIALQQARGEYIAWFDDDDWQHPERLGLTLDALGASKRAWGGTRDFWFADLVGEMVTRANGARPSFNSAVFRRDVALSGKFDERFARGSDTLYLREICKRAPMWATVNTVTSFWLCHDTNISNPSAKRRFALPMDGLRTAVGSTAWGSTDEQLTALRDRMSARGNTQLGTDRDAAVVVLDQNR